MAHENREQFDWYDFTDPQGAYRTAVCRWGAAMAAYAKAMGALFELAADYQLDATRSMARMPKDPAALAQWFTSAFDRKMALWNELQPIMERMQRDADLMYERIRREVDAESAGGDPGEAAGGGSVDPGRRYGHPAAEGSHGGGGEQHDADDRPGGYRRVARVKT